MKKRNLFITLGLALGLGVAGVAGLAQGKEAVEVDATNNITVYLNTNNYGDDEWADYAMWAWKGTGAGSWIKMTAMSEDHYFSATVDFDSFDHCKFVRYQKGAATPNWDWDQSNQDLEFDSTKTLYTLSGRSGGKMYGSWSTYIDPQTKYSFTAKVNFTGQEVPDYVKICITGEFCGWSDSVALTEMTRVTNTSFTYEMTNLSAGSYQYKVQAVYSNATTINWAHQIDEENDSFTVSYGDEGVEKVLGNSRNYDFAKNMKPEEAATGAKVQLTFASKVPVTVDIIYVGSLTSWGTTKERIDAGKMSPVNSDRLVFEWAIPEGTYTGDYEFKIAAMSAYTTATKVSYTDLVYGVTGSNEVMTVDKTTLTYSYSANSHDLSDLAAYAFAEGFTAAMATPCADEDADNGEAVSAIWDDWKDIYETFGESITNIFKTSSSGKIVQARKLYVHCLDRYAKDYGLDAWANAPTEYGVFGFFGNNVSENGSYTLPVILIITVASLVTLGGVFLLRRKEN